MRQVGVIQPEIRNVTSWQPCEACGVRSVRKKVTLNGPNGARVTHRLCERCADFS